VSGAKQHDHHTHLLHQLLRLVQQRLPLVLLDGRHIGSLLFLTPRNLYLCGCVCMRVCAWI